MLLAIVLSVSGAALFGAGMLTGMMLYARGEEKRYAGTRKALEAALERNVELDLSRARLRHRLAHIRDHSGGD